MPQAKHGKKLFLILACLLSACDKSYPPPIEVCILDGLGGGDCTESDGTKLYRTPSMMKNYWATGETDISNFTSWCYGGTNVTPAQAAQIKSNVNAQIQQVKEDSQND
jgi:hypothetical protein